MNPSFRQRCESALTHPVTIGALGVLLVNDLLFKALWSNPWTTGKLSDLAWVVFASPLLAFLLSLVTRGSRSAERAAFLAAYAGLPLLYAAFNTFEPVHDAILWGLSLAGGQGVGSPLDPTDSIVIPFALAAALWVWRRKPGDSNSLRMRLGLLTAAVAALATVATSPPESVDGTTIVGSRADGTVFSIATDPNYFGLYDVTGYSAEEVFDLAYLYSCDGGLTWVESCKGARQGDSVVLGGQSAETPRGTYVIEDAEIVRALGSEREPVYSAAYLQEAGNRILQTLATRRLGARSIATGPYSITYDSHSGNVIVALGLQGVVVETPEGRWMRVAVGEYTPTNFSVIGKALVLLDGSLWLIAVVLALSFTAFALMMADPYLLRWLKLGPVVLGTIVSIPMAIVVGVALYGLTPSIGLLLSSPAIVLAAAVLALLASRSPGKIWHVVLAVYAILFSIGGILFFAEADVPYYIATYAMAPSAMAFAAFAVTLVLRQLWLDLRPEDRNRIYLVAFAVFLGMLGLVALPFFLWVGVGMDLALVKGSGIVLVAFAALFLQRYAAEKQH